jgi:hypothetical protein
MMKKGAREYTPTRDDDDDDHEEEGEEEEVAGFGVMVDADESLSTPRVKVKKEEGVDE